MYRTVLGVLLLAASVVACTAGEASRSGETPDLPRPVETEASTSTSPPGTLPPPTTTSTVAVATTTTSLPSGVTAPPAWLGTRVLPLRDDGFGQILPTPPEMVDRRFVTADLLPPPGGMEFEWTLTPVPEEVLARSSWTPGCPVGAEALSYLTVTFWGFDQRPHTGEIIVDAAHGEAVVEVFRTLYDARFPIEEMRVIRAEETDAPPTGDGNTTSAFVCRPVSGSTRWSMHAYGLAIDINPFHNPYVRGDVVLPELASAYSDRTDVRPGMIQPDDTVVEAFAAIGWQWGGDWTSLKDWMHFSANGR